jgi:uncharacterized RDD family membrane protein YckC
MSTFERTSYHDQLSIDTPEQVELSYSVAGIGSRFVALLLDKLITYLVYGALILVLVLVLSAVSAFNQAMDKLSLWALAVIVLVYFIINWGYFALFEAYWHGQTPGKRAMKLRVIKDSGRQITLFESLARNLLRFVDELPGFFLIGVITMLCNKQNKRLGDFVAGTLVVHERTDEQPLMFQSSMNFSPAAFPKGDAEPWREVTPGMFPADAVARLTGQDLMVIETFFGRMLDLPMETRAALAYRMAGQMAAKMQVTLPEETNPERALESMAYQMRSGGR